MITLTKNVVATFVQPRVAKSYKGTYGHVVCIGGNQRYGGAIIIAAQAAQKMGAGLITVVTSQDHHSAIRMRTPEIMCVDWQDQMALATVIQTADVLLVGCGLGRDDWAKQMMQLVCQVTHCPVIFDADALYFLATDQSFQPKMPRIYTPHVGEWNRLSNGKNPSKELANKMADCVVVKAERTCIYTSDSTYVVTNGTPAMANGGMGDCLAGSIAGWLAQSKQLTTACCVATWVHAQAAQQLAMKQYVVSASEVSMKFPYILHELSELR